MSDKDASNTDLNGIIEKVTAKLKAEMTLTAPGWVFAVAAIIALVLLGAALD